MKTETETTNQIPKGNFQELQIADIIIDGVGELPAQSQGTLFCDSFESVGQLEPIVVNRIDGKYLIVAGRKRLASAKEIGKTTIEAKVYENLDHKTSTLMTAIENICRKNFDVIQESKKIRDCVDNGYSEKTIAGILKMTVDTIRRRINLLQLCDEVQKMMTRNVNPMPIHQASMIIKLPVSQQIEFARKIAPITGPIMSEKEVQNMLDELKGAKLPLDHADPADRLPSLSQKKRLENKKGTLPGVKKKTETPKQEKTGIKSQKIRKETDDIKLGEVNLDITGKGVLSADGKSITFKKTNSFFKVNVEEIVCNEPMVIFFPVNNKEVIGAFRKALAAKSATKNKKAQSKKTTGNVCPKCKGTVESGCGFICHGEGKWECMRCGKVFMDKKHGKDKK